MTFLRSIPLDADIEAVATVVHVGRRLAVIDCEIGSAGARPSALARVIAARTTHR
jgi:acyl-coenzyme A thioesterase PaaI-like protein